jgi:hypothetical protein
MAYMNIGAISSEYRGAPIKTVARVAAIAAIAYGVLVCGSSDRVSLPLRAAEEFPIWRVEPFKIVEASEIPESHFVPPIQFQVS